MYFIALRSVSIVDQHAKDIAKHCRTLNYNLGNICFIRSSANIEH